MKGTAEIFGTELAIGPEYTFTNYKAAIYTWHGCTLEVTNITKNTIGLQQQGLRTSYAKSSGGNNSDLLPGGGFEGSTVEGQSIDLASSDVMTGDSSFKKQQNEISEYISEESQMPFYANLHFAFENARQLSEQREDMDNDENMSGDETTSNNHPPNANNKQKASKVLEHPPRVLVIGPQDSGKSSLCKILVSYDVKRGRTPMFVNLDTVESVFCAPGSVSAAVISDILDVEQGWGNSPITGPTLLHPKQPLVRFFGLDNPMKNPEYYCEIMSLMAKSVRSRLEDDYNARSSGIYIDTPAALVSPQNKQQGYAIIEKIIQEFDINVLLVVGNEKLYSDMKKTYESNNSKIPLTAVVKVPKSGGAVDRDIEFMTALQSSLINEYFYGTPKQPLSPYTVTINYSHVKMFRIAERKISASETESSSATSAVTTTTASNSVSSSKDTSLALPETSTESETIDKEKSSEEQQSSLAADTTTTDTTENEEKTVVVSEDAPTTETETETEKTSSSSSRSNDEKSEGQYLISLEPSSIVENGLLAVLAANPEDPIEEIAKANVLGYVHIVEADDNRKRMRILMPVYGRLPNCPLVLGDFRYYE